MIVVALADSDSYLKWAAATLDRVVPNASRHIVVVANPVMPSSTQRAAAIASSSWSGQEIPVVDADSAVERVRELHADAVLVAMRGPMAAVLLAMLADLSPRPVLITGIPGIAIPARRKALIYRAQADLMLVHSHCEREAFSELALEMDVSSSIALTSLPFLDRSESRGDDVVLAAQALVPATRREREMLVAGFVAAAARHPDRRFVLKVRARHGERQTHDERWPLDVVMQKLGSTPANLVVRAGPMSESLDRAGALVSVSSTAIIEAVARTIPALAIADFGVGDAQLNRVFEGSGLIGSLDDLAAGRFRTVDETWARRNYLHEPSDDDVVNALDDLLSLRRHGALAERLPRRSQRGGALRAAWDRRTALGRHDGRRLGVVALVVGTPARALVRATARWR